MFRLKNFPGWAARQLPFFIGYLVLDFLCAAISKIPIEGFYFYYLVLRCAIFAAAGMFHCVWLNRKRPYPAVQGCSLLSAFFQYSAFPVLLAFIVMVVYIEKSVYFHLNDAFFGMIDWLPWQIFVQEIFYSMGAASGYFFAFAAYSFTKTFLRWKRQSPSSVPV